MEISLGSVRSRFISHSESVSSEFVPNSEKAEPLLTQPIDQSVFENHEEIFGRYGITPETLKLIPQKGGITKCPTSDGDLYIHWGARTIVPPERCPLRNSFSKT